MTQDVVELSEQETAEGMTLVYHAFAQSPQMPVLMDKPYHTASVLQSLVELYADNGTIKTFGIKDQGRLVCVGLCVDSDAKPSLRKTLTFAHGILRTLGVRGMHQFWVYHRHKPRYEKRCLELMLYATTSEDQQKGYGRAMLEFLYEYAHAHRYGGVTGVTNTSRPAFHFYMRDGWVVDAEFRVHGYRICWVRRNV
ncbi:MAG: hypothetical protein JXA00_01175 [Candidatus Thermoplasmatota archaeon]|nr:hypothetical protein [Candidatus Thermoplasmatota archaeon]